MTARQQRFRDMVYAKRDEIDEWLAGQCLEVGMYASLRMCPDFRLGMFYLLFQRTPEGWLWKIGNSVPNGKGYTPPKWRPWLEWVESAHTK